MKNAGWEQVNISLTRRLQRAHRGMGCLRQQQRPKEDTMNHLTDGPMHSLVVMVIITVVMIGMGVYYAVLNYLNATPGMDEVTSKDELYTELAIRMRDMGDVVYMHDDVRVHARMDEQPTPTDEEMRALYVYALTHGE